MKITIESTTKIVKLNGIDCRVWEGATETGIPIHCFVSRVAVKNGMEDRCYQQFEAELQEQRVPSPEIEAIPLRMIL